MNEIQRLQHEVERPTPHEDYVWSSQMADYSTKYHNKELGTVAFTHIGGWTLTAEATLKLLEAQER